MNKINFYNDNKLKFIDKQVPKSNENGLSSYAITCYLGECNSGKTYNCVKNILKQCEDGQIKHVDILSPTYHVNPIWKLLDPWIRFASADLNNAVEFMKQSDEASQLEYELWHALHIDYSMEEFNSILNYLAFHAKMETLHPGFLNKLDKLILKFSRGDAKWFKDPPAVAIALDDCQGSDLFSSKYFRNSIMRHRHKGEDIHILLQHFIHSIPGCIKGITNRWFNWGLKSDKDIYDMYRLTAARYCDYDDYLKVMKLITLNEKNNKNESFLIIDSKSDKHRFRLGFNNTASNLHDILLYLDPNAINSSEDPQRKKRKSK